MNASSRQTKGDAVKELLYNKKARFEYHILETFEAGLVLSGAEIKSVRANGMSINESYVRPFSDGMFLLGAQIAPYSHASGPDREDPLRPRRLLLHQGEIDRLRGRVEQKGLTIVPVRVYLKNGRAKIEIALARGKDNPDKRDAIKDRDAKRDLARVLKGGARE
jgi:SsrA-binding protein